MRAPRLADGIGLALRTLSGHGNLGPGLLLFVLKDALAAGAPLTPRVRMVAFGPGQVAAVLCLDDVALPS